MSESYHESIIRSKKYLLEEHLKELPPYCARFFKAKENKLEPRTLCGYAEDLLVFFRYLNKEGTEIRNTPIERLKSLSTEDIDNYMSYIGRYTWQGQEYHNGEAGKQRKLSSLRMFIRYLCKTGKMDTDPTALVEMPKRHKKNIVILTQGDKKELIDTILKGGKVEHYQQRAKLEKNRIRDYAVIMVLLGTGIRVSELAGLNLSDINFTEKRLSIIRKGGDEDNIYFGQDVEKALKRYLFTNEDGCRESFTPDRNEPAVFISQQHNRMTVRSIQKMVKVYADLTFGKGNKYTPHKMRSSYGTALWEQTHDLELVSVALGHSSIETAKKHYVRVSEKQKKRAAIPVI